MNIYYVYAYIRRDGSPYYIGKGKEMRAFQNHKHHRPPKDLSRIVFLEQNLTELGALAIERRYIRWYGRKDNNTGILINKTDGGEGASGLKFSDQTLKRLSEIRKGNRNGMFGKTHSDSVKVASSIRRAKTNSERSWYNNGKDSKFLKECPEGWTKGRLNQKPTTLGNKWYNNGVIAVCAKQKPFGNEWVSGMLPRTRLK